MTDSYHFASVPQFRVGGVYRDGEDRAYLLREAGGEVLAVAAAWDSCARKFDDRGEFHRLDNGRFDALAEQNCHWHLIPGELHQVDGAWVPVEQKLSFPSGSVLTTSGDKIVGREEPKTLGALLQGVLDRGIRKPCPEPIRPALIWRTETPFDSFGEGWHVYSDPITSGFAPAAAMHTSPTTADAYPANSNLLKTA